MAIIKTHLLVGLALDWAVAKCEGKVSNDIDDFCLSCEGEYNYSTNWAQGGPIIEREKISLLGYATIWNASAAEETIHDGCSGETALIAAMRCHVFSKLGDMVDIPDELVS